MRQRNEHLADRSWTGFNVDGDWRQELPEARSCGVNTREHGAEKGTLTSTSQGAKDNVSNTPREGGNQM